MGKGKKKSSSGSSAKTTGADPVAQETGALPVTHTAAPTSGNCTAPSTPDELSPSMAVTRPNGNAMKNEPSGSSKVDPNTNGKAVAIKNGKGHAKAAPLPPGFLESELQLHKRKLKTAEDAIDTHRQEVAALKRQLAEAAAESQELRDIKAVLESACRAAHDAQEKKVGLGSPTGNPWLALVGVSFVSLSAVVAVAMAKSTTSQSR